MALRYFLPVDSLPPRDEGITITRDLYVLKDTVETKALTEAKQGDIVRGRLTLTIPGDYEHVAIEDIIPAGFEIVNFNLATEDQSLQNESTYVGQAPLEEGQNYGLASRFWQGVRNALGGRTQLAQVYQQGGGYYDDTASQANKRTLYPTHTEAHDDRIFLYVENLNPGVYEYEYFLRALVPGTFQHLPARAEEMYFPEIFGRTSGGIFTITAE